MNELLGAVNQQLQQTKELLVAALILVRIMSMIVVNPIFGGKLAPIEVKMGMGMLFTILVWPLARLHITDLPSGPFIFFFLMLKEAFVGFVIGFVASHIFTAMEMAGRLIDTVRGSSMAEVLDPHSKGRATPFGDLYSQLLLVIFVMVGGHHIFLQSFFLSFKVIPLDAMIPMDANAVVLMDYMIQLISHILVLASILAAPVVAATLISDVVFGILNRVAPQLNAYFMSMPVKAMGGVIMVIVIMSPFIARLETYTVWLLETTERTITLLTPLG